MNISVSQAAKLRELVKDVREKQYTYHDNVGEWCPLREAERELENYIEILTNRQVPPFGLSLTNGEKPEQI